MVKCFLFSPTATTDISQLGTEQLHLIEYSDSGNEIFYISADSMVAASHMWLLSTWNMAIAMEELNL